MNRQKIDWDRVRAARGHIQHALAALTRIDGVVPVRTRDVYLSVALEYTDKALNNLSPVRNTGQVKGLLASCKADMIDARLEPNYVQNVKRQMSGIFQKLYHLEGKLSSWR